MICGILGISTKQGGDRAGSKQKMVQIYEAMAGMMLEMIIKYREKAMFLWEDALEMVRTTKSLYETLNHSSQPII